MEELVIIGAGGLGREALHATLSAAENRRAYRVVGFLDDAPARRGTTIDGVPVLGGRERIPDLPQAVYLACVGGARAGSVRATLVDVLGLPPDRWARVVSTDASIAHGTTIGEGAVILAGVVATAPIEIGAHTTFMPGCVLTHDVVVEDYAVLASGVKLGGSVVVGRGAYLGMGVCIREGLRIGDGATVGMGSVVLRDVPAGETWVGAPARRLR